MTAVGDAVLDGFNLHGGVAMYGGGMFGGRAVHCILADNAAKGASDGLGGGMCRGTSVECAFSRNSARYGGGMFSGTADKCTFTDNSVSGSGGGMYVGTATGCTFRGNSANWSGGMLGTAINCLFAANRAYSGGGMYQGTAVNCTFTGNVSDGGIGNFYYYGTVTNCIFWGNSPEYINGESIAVSYSCLSVPTAGVCNIVADPLFVNAAAGDYRLQPGSPCINAGTGAGAPAVDILGAPRPQGPNWDMGAYEHAVDVAVPNVTGVARLAAEQLITSARLYIGREAEEYHYAVPANHVIRQNPAAGARVPERTPVDTVISKGPHPPVPVPDVVGQALSAASTAIAAAGLALWVATEQYSLTVPAGAVITQTPVGGAEAAYGALVFLVISKGGIAVPNVIGRTESDALTALREAGLAMGTVTRQYSVSVPAGTVLSQVPVAGALVLPDAEIGLVVSRGVPPVAMPNVVGLFQAQAESILTGAGFVVGLTTRVHSGAVAAGAVISQSPAPGVELPPKTAVSIVLSLGPAPAAEGENNLVDADSAKIRLAAAYASADSNRDGWLSFDEATASMTDLSRATFDMLDTNADERLTQDELGITPDSGCVTGCRGTRGTPTSDAFALLLGFLCFGVLNRVHWFS